MLPTNMEVVGGDAREANFVSRRAHRQAGRSVSEAKTTVATPPGVLTKAMQVMGELVRERFAHESDQLAMGIMSRATSAAASRRRSARFLAIADGTVRKAALNLDLWAPGIVEVETDDVGELWHEQQIVRSEKQNDSQSRELMWPVSLATKAL